MFDALAQAFQNGGQGPQTLGAMPNPAQQQQQPMFDPSALQNPATMGLLGAGMNMLGASGQGGGLGEALGAGVGGGLGGLMQGQAMQQQQERNSMLDQLLQQQAGIGNAAMQGMGAAPQQPMPPQQPMQAPPGALGGGLGGLY